MIEQISTLGEFLFALAAGVLTVPIVTWVLFNLPQEVFSRFGGKFAVALVLSFALGTVGQIALILLNYVEPGANVREMLELFYPVWLTSFTASQVIFAGIKSRVPR